MLENHKKMFDDLVSKDWVQEIVNSEEFYFQKAQDAFNDFDNYQPSNIELYQYLYNLDYKTGIENIRKNKTEGADIIEKIDILIAYFDSKGKNKETLNKYKPARTLARAGIYQDKWIKQLLLYKIAPDRIAESVQNVISYIQNPKDGINMISPQHRSMVAQMLMKTEYNPHTFVADVKAYFSNADLQLKNEDNKTLLFNEFFYRGGILGEWCNITGGLIARDTTDWKNALIRDVDKSQSKYSIVWWHRKPNGYNKEIREKLKTKIADDGFFYLYYVADNKATYRGRVVDFIGVEDYASVMPNWRSLNPAWFEDNPDNYHDDKQQASIIFLLSEFKQLHPPIDISDFIMYKGAEPPHRANMAAFGYVYENEIHNEMQSSMTKEITEIKEILLNKKQIILQGAPGTGKTYNTAAIALSILDIPFDISDHDGIMEKYETERKKGNIHFTTFHQSMDYEDFVEGLKPKVVKGGVSYEIEDGIFKKVCKTHSAFNIGDKIGTYEIVDVTPEIIVLDKPRANSKVYLPRQVLTDLNASIKEGCIKLNDKGKYDIVNNQYHVEPYMINGYPNIFPKLIEIMNTAHSTNESRKVIIIDEINRGNISKIFGELITLLEADKRKGSKSEHPITVKLPYSKQDFSVPDNVYIIGTMNTTDRSVGYIDYAVRRRFAFYTLQAKPEAIEQYYYATDQPLGDKAIALFGKVKELINDRKAHDMDIDDLMIGHSYFMAKTQGDLLLKLKYEIAPLLFEYDKDGILNLTSENKKTINEEWPQLLRS